MNAIETNVDKLVEYVYAKGEASSANAAEALGIPIEQVEEWAVPLEENEMIQIKYSPLHGMILVSRSISKKELGVKVDEFKERKEKLKKEEKRIENAFNRYTDSLGALQNDMKEIEKNYGRKVKEAKTEQSKKEMTALLNNLNALHEKLEVYEREADTLQKEKNDLGRMIDDFKRDVVNTDKKAALVAQPKELGIFYEFLAKAEKELIAVKKREDKFIEQTILLRKRTDALVPLVQSTHTELHKSRFNIFRVFRFWRKK